MFRNKDLRTPTRNAKPQWDRRASSAARGDSTRGLSPRTKPLPPRRRSPDQSGRSEEHTSELQSRGHLVCRLLLEKKKKTDKKRPKKQREAHAATTKHQ